MIGNIHSIQSLGAVDGPGVRYVVFMQGCPLRCVYCHNPDTWLTEGGTPTDVDELVRKALRFRPYWKNGGGVTVTGGEPLLQAEFVEEFFAKLHEHGVHTALDTSGVGNLSKAEKVLAHTDLVLCDLKFLTKADYLKNCRADFDQIERFLQLTAMKNVPLWIRHVVVPGLTDGMDHLRRVKAKAESYPNFEKLEFLPFHKLCMEKYERLGLEFPLKDTPAMNPDALKTMVAPVSVPPRRQGVFLSETGFLAVHKPFKFCSKFVHTFCGKVRYTNIVDEGSRNPERHSLLIFFISLLPPLFCEMIENASVPFPPRSRGVFLSRSIFEMVKRGTCLHC